MSPSEFLPPQLPSLQLLSACSSFLSLSLSFSIIHLCYFAYLVHSSVSAKQVLLGGICIQFSHSSWVLYTLNSRCQKRLTSTFQFQSQIHSRENLGSSALSRCPPLVSAPTMQQVYGSASSTPELQTNIGTISISQSCKFTISKNASYDPFTQAEDVLCFYNPPVCHIMKNYPQPLAPGVNKCTHCNGKNLGTEPCIPLFSPTLLTDLKTLFTPDFSFRKQEFSGGHKIHHATFPFRCPECFLPVSRCFVANHVHKAWRGSEQPKRVNLIIPPRDS